MKTYVDSNWDWSWCNNTTINMIFTDSKWIELALSTPLKIVASMMFNINFDILNGQTVKSRIERENTKTIKYNICGELTGRQVLEFMGTNIMRNKFNENFWINLTEVKCKQLMGQGKSIIISDIRFENEYQMLLRLKGKLYVLYKNKEDLNISNDDHDKHPAKWNFKLFAKNAIHIHNDSTIENLKNKIYSLI